MTDSEFMDNFSREQILALYACGRCGDCMLACPIYEETRDEKLSPAFRLRVLKSLSKSKYGLRALIFGPRKEPEDQVKELVDPVFKGCTVCGRCMTVCPFNFDLIELWETARKAVVKSGFGPTSALQVQEAIEADKNVYKMPKSARKEWLEYEEVEDPTKEKAEMVYFVGCVTSYSGMMMSVAHAVASILNEAGEDWTLLNEEWCCGSPLRFAGTTEQYKEFAEKNVEAIEATGAKRVVFNCPSCYRRFVQDYPELIGRKLGFQPIHIVELVDQYVKEGRFKPNEKLKETITYHDPCELTRLLDIVDEPRRVINAFASNFVEMSENKVNCRCCGQGGLLGATDPELSLTLGKNRIKQVEEIGAKILTSACPACKLNLDEAAAEMESDIQVLDLTEIIAQQLGLMDG
jgi:heterodisulfide reductase subunit D